MSQKRRIIQSYQKSTMNTFTHSGSTYITSNNEWKGSRPQKFYGGRKHDNHPFDELDHLLLGHDTSQAKPLGPSKRRFQNITTIGTDSPSKPHIRPNAFRNESSIEFGHQQIPKIIKIGKETQHNPNMSSIYRQSKAGESKLKNLQQGNLQTGIYRNFYQSQMNKNYETIA